MIKRTIIKGNSMEPTLYEGEMYLVRTLRNKKSINVGDIVVAEINGHLVAKRVSKIHKIGPCRYFDLNGDNIRCSKNFKYIEYWNIKYKMLCPTVFTLLFRLWRKVNKENHEM